MPKQFDRPTVVWLALAAVVSLIWIILLVNNSASRAFVRLEGQLAARIADFRSPGMVDATATASDLVSVWLVPVVGWTTLGILLVAKQWRHVIVYFASLVVTTAATGIARDLIARPRPVGTAQLARWEGWAQPSRTVAIVTAALVGSYCALVPPGRWRAIAPLAIGAFVVGYASAEVYLGLSHPSDVITAVFLGSSIPILGFRIFAPEEVFPVSYRRGNTAHLDVSGARGEAISRAVENQLGLAVTRIRPIGAEGSAGSTPLVLYVDDAATGDPHPPVFAKLLARSHLQSDRWYKLARTLMYGRLEDETRFQTVRRLVQQEDYLTLRFTEAGVRVPKTYGVVEITPEREYLLVTEFLDGFTEIGEAVVTVDVIDNALAAIRRLWDAGLAHRDIKPANVMVRGNEVALIDVAFGQIRPSPWRQAVDLANMMMVLALRSDTVTVYQRALLQFSPEDVAEAFAASRGITLPSQVRREMKRAGRDLVAEFRRLAPPYPAIPIQRWSARRLALTLWVLVISVLLFFLTLANLTATGLLP